MKSSVRTPKFKIQRRLLVELPGLGKPGALERKPYPPGEHGSQRIKYSDYRLQLEEKQKIKFHYGLRESQLKRFVDLAKRSRHTVWMESLIGLLETRIDNLVFRAGLAPSMRSAQQAVSHGKIFVNGKRLDIKSALLRVGDEIEVSTDYVTNQNFLNAQGSPRLPFPDWLEKTTSATGFGGGFKIILKETPTLSAVPFNFDAALVTSYYSI